MQKQKFIVGELVSVATKTRPDLNTSCAEIVEASYTEGINASTLEPIPTSWCYKTSNMTEEKYVMESALRKLPKQGDSFEELMAKLKLDVPA